MDPRVIEGFLEAGKSDELFRRLARYKAISFMTIVMEYGHYVERDWRLIAREWEEEIRQRFTTYLIHLDRPIGDPSKRHGTAQHYVGYSHDPYLRLKQHRNGTWTKKTALLYAANQQGIPYRIVRLWRGGRRTEEYIKAGKNHPKLCPICNPDGWARWAEKWTEKWEIQHG